MTQPLRRFHFWAWLAIAIVIVTGFVASLLARRSTTPANPGVHWDELK